MLFIFELLTRVEKEFERRAVIIFGEHIFRFRDAMVFDGFNFKNKVIFCVGKTPEATASTTRRLFQIFVGERWSNTFFLYDFLIDFRCSVGGSVATWGEILNQPKAISIRISDNCWNNFDTFAIEPGIQESSGII